MIVTGKRERIWDIKNSRILLILSFHKQDTPVLTNNEKRQIAKLSPSLRKKLASAIQNRTASDVEQEFINHIEKSISYFEKSMKKWETRGNAYAKKRKQIFSGIIRSLKGTAKKHTTST